jgi:hypothetical protein
MPSKLRSAQDITALALATIGTALLCLGAGSGTCPSAGPTPGGASTAALAELLDAELAAREATLLLDQPIEAVTLSFASEHDRLVWRARSHDRTVLLDARTGEALAFEFG